MSRPDDFDILSDEPEKPGRSNRWWLWLLIAAAAIFVFAVGMALATFTNRLGDGEDAPGTATALAAVVTYTATPNNASSTTTAVTASATGIPLTPVDAVATATVAALLTATDQPTVAPVAPTATPTSGCVRTIPAQFGPAYRAELGCPTNDAGIVWSAWEWFERGAMFWRADNDRAYAFFNDGGWGAVDEKWEGQEITSRGDPPPNLQAPMRGFGYAWGRRDDLFQRLGWATDQERGFCALIQSFEHGFILQDSDVDTCQDNLFNQVHTGEWRPLFIVAVDGLGWLNLAGTTLPTPLATAAPSTPVITPGTTPVITAEATVAATPTETATPVPTATPATVQRQRPEGNRLFYAANGTHSLDGNLDDWGGNWSPITAIVEGSANYSGSDDANGEFQLSWSLEGLYLAIRVRDDRYRAGPNGSDMWQGDGLELHFDRELSGDYADNFANGDDYQLGLSWGPDRNETRLYRWLPQTAEGTFPLSGAVIPDGEGYVAEVLIPWTLFDVTSGQLQTDQRFGFNLSISDNDADAPAQESILSASPSRTTYNNPTEWGTLILQ